MNMNLAVMRAIARIIRSDQNTGIQEENGRMSIPHPAAVLRLLIAILCILLCALSRNAWFTVSVLAVELLRTALKPPHTIAYVLRPVGVAVSFAAVFSLPAVFLGSPGSFGTIVMKVAESVLVLSLMNEEVSWKETTGAFEALHLPGVVTMTLDHTIRFLVILGRFSNAMIEAVSLRRVGEKKWHNAGTGGILGTTFLKSQQMAVQTSEAMICRGFTGSKPAGGTSALYGKKNKRRAAVNAAYLLLMPLLIAGFAYTQSLML